ncbi:asparagine synthase (glutamine-hydrolyzing) [Streptomyces sp. NPDC059008]|uniref:asparagine synthase (glutamine-hydrolyzing) n=1 Tax=Streptomyces sp. NPDC059008 TaxID=3346693 RepID=UPI00367A502B
MCGVAGLVRFDRDLGAADRTAVAAMTETMSCRGPDAGDIWQGRHALLGHRRLAIIDLPGGRQPMVRDVAGHGAAATVALSYSGEIYNFQELRTELIQQGHRFETRSDTEVVLCAYLQWGDAFVDRLNGMFAFALWDGRTEELLLVRDRLGVKPLYWQPTPAGALFGSEPKAILAHPDVRGDVGIDGLREIFSLTRTPGKTPYTHLHEVEPGTFVRIRDTGSRVHRYWSVTAQEHTDSLDATVATVRDLLEDATRRQLVADVPQCVLLSGGLDSSLITSIAARAMQAQGARIPSFAVDFESEVEFEASELRGEPDPPYARLLAAQVGTDHADLVLKEAELMDPGTRAAVAAARDVPTGWGDLDTSLYLLFQAIRGKSTVALSGEGADEFFGGYPWFHRPEAVNAEQFPWAGLETFSLADPATSRLTLLSPELRAELDMEAHAKNAYQEALAEVPRLPGESRLERRMREIGYMHITRWLPEMLDRKDRMSMAVGLEVRVPFCDHRLVQYAFNIPWSMKSFDGREKSLLRLAARDLVPDAIIQRKKASYAVTQSPAYMSELRRTLADIVADSTAPVHQLLDRDAVRRAVSPPEGEHANTGRSAIELVLSLDLWLRRTAPAISL